MPAVRSASLLLLLALPAGALRSSTRKTSGGPRTLEDFRAARIDEIRNDHRMELLKDHFRGARRGIKHTKGAVCSISDAESCPLGAMIGTTAVFPGGKTKCMSGDPYHFVAVPGAADKLLIHLEGGGTCWNHESFEMGLCSRGIAPGLSNSVFGFRNSCLQKRREVRNPFVGYTAVHVRYCSGDAHLGDRQTTWETTDRITNKTVTVEQRGYQNALAALDWAKANTKGKLESLVVSGASAGGSAAWVWGPLLLSLMSYERATVIVEANMQVNEDEIDGAIMKDIGACPSSILATARPLREQVPLCKPTGLPIKPIEWRDMMIASFPKVTFAALNSKFDAVQVFHYNAVSTAKQLGALRAHCGGEGSCDVSGAPRELLARRAHMTPEEYYRGVNAIIEYHSHHPNYSWYLVTGEYHIMAERVFGSCASAGYSLPGFTLGRRVHAQRWVSGAVLSSTPRGICEEMPYKGWNGACNQTLGSVIVRA